MSRYFATLDRRGRSVHNVSIDKYYRVFVPRATAERKVRSNHVRVRGGTPRVLNNRESNEEQVMR